eukprot:363295-Chlamydomonas_euryale.AAC.4
MRRWRLAVEGPPGGSAHWTRGVRACICAAAAVRAAVRALQLAAVTAQCGAALRLSRGPRGQAALSIAAVVRSRSRWRRQRRVVGVPPIRAVPPPALATLCFRLCSAREAG